MILTFKNLVSAAAVAVVANFSAGMASAVTCGSLNASASYSTFTSCIVNGQGPAGQDRFATVDQIVASLFGDEGYDVLAADSFAPNNSGGGGAFGIQSTAQFSVVQDSPFTFTFSALPLNTLFVSIKNGNGNSGGGFELFRVPMGGLPFTLTHSLAQPGVSHFSTFGGIAPSAVPLPAGGLLLIAGLGGLAALRRRNRRA